MLTFAEFVRKAEVEEVGPLSHIPHMVTSSVEGDELITVVVWPGIRVPTRRTSSRLLPESVVTVGGVQMFTSEARHLQGTVRLA